MTAVLGSTVQRAAPPTFPSRTGPPIRRRIVVGVLVLLSLALITIHFREPSDGPLHGVEGAAATVLRPFEIAAERIARPFRDVYGYFSGLVHAKSENEELRREVDRLRQEVTQAENARRDAASLRALLHFQDSKQFPQDYAPVHARITGRAPSAFEQQVVIAAGSNAGIRVHSPVVTGDGLVGEVTQVYGSMAQVTLLTDPESAVQALVQRTQAEGVVQHGQGDGSLVLARVGKEDDVRRGDVVVTAGTRSRRFPSLYPRGIPVGRITNVGQTDVDLFKQIQIKPFVDFSSLDAVTVLVAKKRVGAAQ